MSAFTVNPTGTPWPRWSGAMVLSLSSYGNIPRIDDPAQWRFWANVVVSIPAIAAVAAPRPERFATWQDWAHQFNMAVRLLG